MWLFYCYDRNRIDGQIDFAKDSIPGITISVVDRMLQFDDQKTVWKNGKDENRKTQHY